MAKNASKTVKFGPAACRRPAKISVKVGQNGRMRKMVKVVRPSETLPPPYGGTAIGVGVRVGNGGSGLTAGTGGESRWKQIDATYR